MKRIGITGGIGAGKTTVSKIFEKLGVPVYYADEESKKIIGYNLMVKKQIKSLLGEDSYYKNGKPNKKYIASRIFNDNNMLQAINQIIHPAVLLDSERWFETLKNAQVPYALKEAALLVETASYKYLDALILVTCPENIRIERVMLRDKVSKQDVVKRIVNQLSDDDKAKVADFIIINDGVKPLQDQVLRLHQKFNN